MNYYILGSRDDYASYSMDESAEEIDDAKIVPYNRRVAHVLQEYLGNPPCKPKRKGDFHASGSYYYVSAAALPMFEESARGGVIAKPVRVIGREDEAFFQVWLVNVVDCLDQTNTEASPPTHTMKGRIGVIRKPVFDEEKWDGSDLFSVPQDPNNLMFCTSLFIERWRKNKLKGALFAKHRFDSQPTAC